MTDPAEPIARLQSELASLERAYSRGHHGLWSAKKRAELFDSALVLLYERAGGPASGASLAALGGYGRMRQLPRSDVDLLILHDGSDPVAVAGLTEQLLYPLWDAGFEVGHAVRTPEEAAGIARERLDALTAMLDTRVIAGDRDLAAETTARIEALVTGDPQAFAGDLREAAHARAERYGSAAHLLEPDLKEGAGGLRDVATLGWLAHAIGGSLEAAGLLRTRERTQVEAAEEFLTRARSAIHLETGKRTDRLLSELQSRIAGEMGFADEPRLSATDGLMRAVFEHARAVAHVRDQVLARFEAGPDTASAAAPPLRGPEEVLRALGAAGGAASPALLDAIEAADVPDPVEWTPEVREAFVSLLRRGDREAIDTLDRLGLLTRFLPAWADVRCRPQRDPYHRFTVDTHLTEAAAGMARMLAGPPAAGDADPGSGPDDPIEREAVAHVRDPDGALVGALLHDIGKIGEGNHVAAGALVARETLDHIGLPAPSRDLAAFMVAEHLLLPDTATRRDLTDENLILDVAARIGTPERLAALYLLAKADAAATGPAAWTPWRQALIRELVGKVQRVFDRGEMGEELAGRLAERTERVRELLAAEPEAAVDRFVLRMPRGYFLSVEPAQAARHFRVIAPGVGSHEVRSAASPGVKPGTYELLVVAADRPGLLSQIAGSLSLAGLSVLSAQVFTTDDDVAADLFEVEGAFEPEVGEERWRAFRSTLRKAIEGRISLDHRVAEKRRHYPAPRGRAPVTVAVDNDASDFFTVVEVGATDRIGLLFDITRTLADLQLDVHVAKVATYTDRVIDAFYVRDAVGRKVTDLAQVDEIRAVFRERLGG